MIDYNMLLEPLTFDNDPAMWLEGYAPAFWACLTGEEEDLAIKLTERVRLGNTYPFAVGTRQREWIRLQEFFGAAADAAEAEKDKETTELFDVILGVIELCLTPLEMGEYSLEAFRGNVLDL